jgi:hypothetical protein
METKNMETKINKFTKKMLFKKSGPKVPKITNLPPNIVGESELEWEGMINTGNMTFAKIPGEPIKGLVEMKTGGCLQAHWHEAPEMYVAYQGKGIVKLDGKEHVVDATNGIKLVDIPGRMVHETRNPFKKTFKFFYFFPESKTGKDIFYNFENGAPGHYYDEVGRAVTLMVGLSLGGLIPFFSPKISVNLDQDKKVAPQLTGVLHENAMKPIANPITTHENAMKPITNPITTHENAMKPIANPITTHENEIKRAHA